VADEVSGPVAASEGDVHCTRSAKLEQDPGAAELRGWLPGWMVGVLDAECNARGGNVSRFGRVMEVLEEHCRAKVREATVIQNVMRGHPLPADVRGRDPA
jgi:hypothetical protein